MRRVLSSVVVASAVGLAMLAAGGCSPARPFQKMNDIGSTQFAVLSVTNWDDFKTELSPAFDLSAKDALALATPDTRLFESTVLDAFRSKLSVRVAPNEVLLPGFGTPQAPAGLPAGTPPSLPGVTAAGDSAKAKEPSLGGSDPRLAASEGGPSTSTLKGDAFLNHLAATALFQEVKLLERYVKDAAQKKDYQAFIVRLQITNQPFADKYGYDTYANVAFFMDPITPDGSVRESELRRILDLVASIKKRQSTFVTQTADGMKPFDELEAVVGQLEGDARSLTDSLRKRASAALVALEKAKTGVASTMASEDAAIVEDLHTRLEKLSRFEPPDADPGAVPTVIPLLVTDQVESALISGRAEELRQLAFGISAAFAGLGADLNLDKIDQAIEKAAGRSYRSLYSVGRLADNMLRVRLAARAVPNAEKRGQGFEYQTMARSYNVTLLLLVPGSNIERGPKSVHAATRYEYRWPDSGKLVGVDDKQQGDGVGKSALQLIRNGGYRVTLEKLDETKALNLVQLAQGNDYPTFLNEFRSVAKTGSEGHARRLFMDLNVAKLGSNFDSTRFEVQMSPAIQPSFGSGPAFALDNGSETEIVINGVAGLDPTGVNASWHFSLPGADPKVERTLAASSAESRRRSQLTLKFPSLLKLGMVQGGVAFTSAGNLTVSHPGVDAAKSIVVSSYLAKGPPAEVPSLVITKSVETLVPTGDAAAASVDLGLVANKSASLLPDAVDAAINDKAVYVLSFTGASVSVSGAEAVIASPTRPGVFAVLKSGNAKFTLTNLPAGGKVKIEVTPPAGGQKVDAISIPIKGP